LRWQSDFTGPERPILRPSSVANFTHYVTFPDHLARQCHVIRDIQPEATAAVFSMLTADG
jgi:hypothetical protein